MDKKMLLFVMICFLLVNSFESLDFNVTEEEDLEMERQLKIINKPFVKTITTEDGIYDCVDIYKQPAFDHPLLKNHTIYYREMDNNSSSINEDEIFKPLKDGGCPIGSVPIRRTTKADLIREKQNVNVIPTLPTVHMAVVHTTSERYRGGGMTAHLYKPSVNAQQYSGVRMMIKGAGDIIQVGWRVDPSLYGDDKVRLYVYFQKRYDYKPCYNLKCPGFVHINKDYVLDYAFQNYYRGIHKPIPYIPLYVSRDTYGNWWFEVGEKRHPVGYWPKNIFNGLTMLATYMDWGGEVLNTMQDSNFVDMGLGSLPSFNNQQTALIRAIKVINPEGDLMDPIMTAKFTNKRDKYGVLSDFRSGYYGKTVFYGGPREQIK